MVLSEDIAVALNVHADPFLVRTNVNLLKMNLTENIHMLIEESGYDSWPLDKFKDITVIKGFKHNFRRNPYRNVFYNLIETYNKFPDKKWYCYCEYDNFILNDTIKKDLSLLNKNYQLVTSDFRGVYCDGYLFEKFFKKIIRTHSCMLGCCYFIGSVFMKQLCEKLLPDFLNYSTLIPDCYNYPNFFQYDMAEVFIPTACMILKHGVFNLCSKKVHKYVGMSNFYRMRFQPSIKKNDLTEKTCMVHPIKNKDIFNVR